MFIKTDCFEEVVESHDALAGLRERDGRLEHGVVDALGVLPAQRHNPAWQHIILNILYYVT